MDIQNNEYVREKDDLKRIVETLAGVKSKLAINSGSGFKPFQLLNGSFKGKLQHASELRAYTQKLLSQQTLLLNEQLYLTMAAIWIQQNQPELTKDQRGIEQFLQQRVKLPAGAVGVEFDLAPKPKQIYEQIASAALKEEKQLLLELNAFALALSGVDHLPSTKLLDDRHKKVQTAYFEESSNANGKTLSEKGSAMQRNIQWVEEQKSLVPEKVVGRYIDTLLSFRDQVNQFNTCENLNDTHKVMSEFFKSIKSLGNQNLRGLFIPTTFRAQGIAFEGKVKYFEYMLKVCQLAMIDGSQFDTQEKEIVKPLLNFSKMLDLVSDLKLSTLQDKYDQGIQYADSQVEVANADEGMDTCCEILGVLAIQKQLMAHRINQVLRADSWEEKQSIVIKELKQIKSNNPSLDEIIDVATPKKERRALSTVKEEELSDKTAVLIKLINQAETILEKECSSIEKVAEMTNLLQKLKLHCEKLHKPEAQRALTFS